MSLSSIVPPAAIASIAAPRAAESTTRAGSVDLGTTFADALRDASEHERSATDAAARFAGGDPAVGIHEVMIASEEANIALRFATTLKNKALDAYRELMATQV